MIDVIKAKPLTWKLYHGVPDDPGAMHYGEWAFGWYTVERKRKGSWHAGTNEKGQWRGLGYHPSKDAAKAACQADLDERVRLPIEQVVLDDYAIEAMVDAMVAQSTAYPVVPPDYTGKVDRLHPFTARQCLLAAFRSRPDLAAMLKGIPSIDRGAA